MVVACLKNKIVLLHSNPFLGKIVMFELDPSGVHRLEKEISFPVGGHVRMQVIDGLVLVHNLDSKTSQAFDLKLIEYN